ncbi:MAG: protein kinase [Planctomycetota bacterium]|nr:protein kinase [Planctomycetota bacterium]
MTACPVCGKEYDTDNFPAGQKLRCGSCQTRLKVGRRGSLEIRHDASEATRALEAVERQDRFSGDELPDLSSIGYRTIEKVGEGGMGTVFKAEHQLMERISAVKVLKRAFSDDKVRFERFLIEARALAQLNHENILKIFDIKTLDDMTLMVLEFIEGRSMIDELKEKGKLGPDEAIQYLLQSARGLGAAHEKGIIHRDIKPGNLMLCGGQVRIADFGLARSVAGEVGVTRVGQLLGTPLYMSPEQAQGEKAGPEADIYCLGATFFHLLAGRPPYTGMGISSVLKSHIQDPPPNLRMMNPKVSEDFAILIGRMMAKKPEHRFKDGNVLASELADFTQTRRTTAPADAPAPTPELPPTINEQTDLRDSSSTSSLDAPRQDSVLDAPRQDSGLDTPRPGSVQQEPFASQDESIDVESPADDIFSALADSGMPDEDDDSPVMQIEVRSETDDHQDALMDMLQSQDPDEEPSPAPEQPAQEVDSSEADPASMQTYDLLGGAAEMEEDEDETAEEDPLIEAEEAGEEIPPPGAAQPEPVMAGDIEDIRPEKTGDWQRIILSSLLEPITGSALMHLLILSAGAAAAFTFVSVPSFIVAGKMSGQMKSVISMFGTGAGLAVIITALCGFWNFRIRWMLTGRRITSMPTLGNFAMALPSGFPLFLILAVFILIPVLTRGLGLGFTVQTVLTAIGSLAAPLAMIGLISGKSAAVAVNPSHWARPHILGSMKYLPAAAAWSGLMLILVPLLLLIGLMFPAGMAVHAVEPHIVSGGASLPKGIVGVFFLAFMVFLLTQYALWAGGCILFKAWRPRQEFFEDDTPKMQSSGLLAAALGIAITIGLLSTILIKLNMGFGGGTKLKLLLYGPQTVAVQESGE